MPTKSHKQPASFRRIADDVLTDRVGFGSFEMLPSLLVERFGEPSFGDGAKVSGEFVFSDERGNVVVIYDWKMTSLYQGTLSPEEFWELDEIVPLQLGGPPHARKVANSFLGWLDRTLVDGLQADQEWLGSLSSGCPCSAADRERIVSLMQNGGEKTQISALEAIARIGDSW